MQTSISILGCGWLGLPLANKLIEANFRVKGSTTSEDKLSTLENAGIAPYLISLPGTIPTDFLESKKLFINIPPGIRRKGEAHHLAQINSLIDQIEFSQFDQVVYINSTAVYPNLNKEVDENDADNSHILMETENLIRQRYPLLTVLRAAGLVGQDRPIVNMLSGKKYTNGSSPTNLIFKDDIVEICFQAITQNILAETINCACDTHPKKKEVYTAWSKKLELAPPIYEQDENHSFKIINNDKLDSVLHYRLKYPDAMNFPVKTCKTRKL